MLRTVSAKWSSHFRVADPIRLKSSLENENLNHAREGGVSPECKPLLAISWQSCAVESMIFEPRAVCIRSGLRSSPENRPRDGQTYSATSRHLSSIRCRMSFRTFHRCMYCVTFSVIASPFCQPKKAERRRLLPCIPQHLLQQETQYSSPGLPISRERPACRRARTPETRRTPRERTTS